jgi:phosphatidylglycerophosphate synthase
MTGFEPGPRRPVSARRAHWAKSLAGALTRLGVRPDQVSVLSVAFASLAGLCLLLAPHAGVYQAAGLFALSAISIELRLLCNLLDGMIAVEGGRATKRGPVFNELPDRISDAVILAAAGYCVAGAPALSVLGWVAGLMAILTAYVRALAGSLAAGQDFGGPMAKQQRMHTVAVACVLATLFDGRIERLVIMGAALAIVAAGSAITAARRTRHLVHELESR